MPILRKATDREYTQIYNPTVLQNEGLNHKQRGLLCQLLSLPDDWRFSIRQLVELTTDGRAALRSGVEALEGKGFIHREQQTREDGGRGCDMWWVLEVPDRDFEPPAHDTPPVGKSNQGGSGNQPAPRSGNRTTTNKEVNKDDDQEAGAREVNTGIDTGSSVFRGAGDDPDPRNRTIGHPEVWDSVYGLTPLDDRDGVFCRLSGQQFATEYQHANNSRLRLVQGKGVQDRVRAAVEFFFADQLRDAISVSMNFDRSKFEWCMGHLEAVAAGAAVDIETFEAGWFKATGKDWPADQVGRMLWVICEHTRDEIEQALGKTADRADRPGFGYFNSVLGDC